MNTGKKTCDILKEIRKTVGEKENIDLQQYECNFKGNCSGTCPKCEKELDEINKKVDHKKLVSILGTIGLASTLVACSPINEENELSGLVDTREKEININKDKQETQILSGDIEPVSKIQENNSNEEEYVYSEQEEDNIKGIDDLNISDDMKKLLRENMKFKNHLRGVISPHVGIRR